MINGPQKYERTARHLDHVPWEDGMECKPQWLLSAVFKAVLWATVIGTVIIVGASW